MAMVEKHRTSPRFARGDARAWLAIACVLASGCTKHEPAFGPTADAAVMEELRLLGAKPLRPSPDGELMAFTTGKPDKPFGISIRALADGRVLSEVYSALPLVRATWRPDGKSIAYFTQDQQAVRHLFFWEIASNVHRAIPIPVTHNQYEVKWSPDGRSLAFSSDEKELIIVRPDESIQRFAGWFRSFSWSPDSKKIALVTDSHAKTDEIIIYDVGRQAGQSLRTPEPWSLVTLDWAPFETMVVRGQTVDKARSSVLVVDPERLTTTVQFEAAEEITDPRWLAEQKGFVWTTRRKGGRQIVVGGRDGTIKFESANEGNTSFVQFTPDRKGAFVSLASPRLVGLARINLEAPGLPPEPIAEANGLPPLKVSQRLVAMRTKDGAQINVDISEPLDPANRSGAVVVRMLGGAIPEFTANWAERQLYLRHGVSYVSVPNRKPHGAGDLLQVCEFLVENNKADPARIVVYGTSTAASVILTAAMRSSGLFGTAAIVGLGNYPAHIPTAGLGKVRLLAFHGGADPFPADKARRLLVEAVGEQAIQPPNGFWHVFPGEAHSLNLADGIVHGTVLAELGLIKKTSVRRNTH